MEYLSPKDGGLPSARVSPKRLRSELVLLLIFLAVTLGTLIFCARALASPSPVVRVMVDREKKGLRINGFDLLLSEAESSRTLAHETRRASIEIKCSLGSRMTANLGKNGTIRVSGPLKISSLGGFIRVGSSQYRDELYVYSFNGDCVVVNHVDLEQYVAGLLDSEMSSRWSLQALMAQAIAARTYAVYQMKEAGTAHFRSAKPPFDLDSSVKDQVYEGAHRETYKAERAVQLTRGMILAYQGKPIKAFYHSTCGGHTETPDRVWGLKLPYIRSVDCEYCRRSPRFNWLYSVGPAELERRLRAPGLLRGRLLGMKVVERNKLGRASVVEIRGAEGTLLVGAPRIRDALGTINLRSTDFSIGHNPDGGPHSGDYVFTGHGSGHGVGMCQWGAKTMGELGYSSTQILSHYYPAALVTRLY